MSFNSGKYTPNNQISDIHLIERNIEEIDKSNFNTTKFFLRTGRPGHLFLKPNYTAFTKTNLGSIPSKLEKTLVKTDTNKPLSTYINNTITTFNNHKDFEMKKKEDKDIRLYSTSFSSKGFGVGFVSKVSRFRDNLSGYLPGPADYSPDKYLTLLSNVEKSPFGKSLFKKKTSASLSTNSNDNLYSQSSQSKKSSGKNKRSITINDDISYDKNISDKNKGSYFFTSTSDRFNGNIFGNRNINPGPGKYFFDNDNIKIKNPDSLSSEFVLPPKKKINPINYFGLNENDNKKFGFHLTNKMKRRKIDSINSLWNKPKFNFEDNLFNKCNKSNISLANNSTAINSLTNNNNSSKIPSILFKDNISKMNNSIKTEYISLVSEKNNSFSLSNEDEYIKNNRNISKKIRKTRKRDNFSLSPPRWDEGYFHDNASHFQVPGPAYYAPTIQNNKKSFNLNNKDFIFTNSLPFKNDNYGTVSSVLI